MKPWIVGMGVALFVCLGCSKQDAREVKRLDVDAAFPVALKSEDVIVRIGTNEFTKADFIQNVALRVRVLELANSHVGRNLNSSAVGVKAFTTYPSQVSMAYAFERYAATSGVVVAEADTNAARQTFQDTCKSGMLAWKNFSKKFSGKTRNELDAEIGRMAIMTAVRRDFFESNRIDVSDDELDACEKWVADRNHRAATTNAAIWATASNVWQSIKRAEITFEDAANKYTQDESKPVDGEWAAFSLDAFADEPILTKTISEMKPGDFTPPIEGDNGLMILKLNDVEVSEKPMEKPRYLLSRIFFRLPMFYETVERDRLRKELLNTKMGMAFSKFAKSLLDTVQVEIVCDKKLFEQARQALENPMAGML